MCCWPFAGGSTRQKSIAIIAACDVVLQKKGDEQIQQAILLTQTKKESIPDALYKALESIVAKAPRACSVSPT